ncbi:SUR7/PalI family-domain-containing protein [Dipodascopsis uninucleata]
MLTSSYRATLLLYLVMLAGTKDHNPLNRTFYLEADTSGISGAPSLTRWTLWNRCSVQNGISSDCTSNKAAYPFKPSQNFGTTSGVPSTLIDHQNRYYYMTRFAYAFFLIAVIFSSLGFLTSFTALFSRLGSGCSSVLTFIALIFDFTAAAIANALFVKARNGFTGDGHSAHLGVKMFAFIWTSVFCLFFASLGFILSCCTGRTRSSAYETGSIADEKGRSNTRGRFFRRRGDKYNATADGESQTAVMHATNDESSY